MALFKKKNEERRFSPLPEGTPPGLKLLFTVVNRSKGELYMELLQSFGVNLQMYMGAKGTAPRDMLKYLSVGDPEKAVILSVIREDREKEILQFLEEKFVTVKNGKGIAFTVSMTGVVGVAIYRFLSDQPREGKQ